jgi:hypothetical protein
VIRDVFTGDPFFRGRSVTCYVQGGTEEAVAHIVCEERKRAE